MGIDEYKLINDVLSETYEDFDNIIHYDNGYKLRRHILDEMPDSVKDKLELIRKILSLSYCDKGGIKGLAPILADVPEAFTLEDITGDTADELAQIAIKITAIAIKAKIHYALWSATKNYYHARETINLYMFLAEATFSLEEWIDTFTYTEIALNVAISLGRKNNDCYDIMCKYILNKIESFKPEDDSLLPIKMIELAIDSKLADLDLDKSYLYVDKAILLARESKNLYRIEPAFELLIAMAKKKNDILLIQKSVAEYAKYFEEQAEDNFNDSRYFGAVLNYQRAYDLYINNNMKDEASRIKKLLPAIQEKQSKNMQVVPFELDFTDWFKSIDELWCGKSINEQVLMFSAYSTIPSKDDIKEQTIESSRSLYRQMAMTLLDSKGRIRGALPSISLSDPEKDTDALEKNMFHDELQAQDIKGIGLARAFAIIRKEHPNLILEDLDFLINDNAIIPEDRKQIFQRGLYEAIMGDWYLALHILVPQVEYIFRCIAQECGADITKFLDDFGEQVKPLGSIFDSPELLECFDNDVIFCFKGLLDSRFGMNLRNDITHGKIDSDMHSNVYYYFFASVIKIISWYSINTHETLSKNVEEVKRVSSKVPPKDDKKDYHKID